MSESKAIFWPMIAHAVLVFALYRHLFSRRVEAVKSGAVKTDVFRVKGAEPEASAKARANLENQFEAPVLFHAVCIALYVTGLATIWPVLIAWSFVVSRYVHAYIHLTRNRLRHRLPAFASGLMLLALLWLWLGIGLALN